MSKPVTIKDVRYLQGALKIDGMYDFFALATALSNLYI